MAPELDLCVFSTSGPKDYYYVHVPHKNQCCYVKFVEKL